MTSHIYHVLFTLLVCVRIMHYTTNGLGLPIRIGYRNRLSSTVSSIKIAYPDRLSSTVSWGLMHCIVYSHD